MLFLGYFWLTCSDERVGGCKGNGNGKGGISLFWTEVICMNGNNIRCIWNRDEIYLLALLNDKIIDF